MVSYGGWQATATTPFTVVGGSSSSGVRTSGGGVAVSYEIGNSLGAHTSLIYPHDYVDARVCALRHARAGSWGPGGSLLNQNWVPGSACPILVDGFAAQLAAGSGYTVRWQTSSPFLLLADTLTVAGWQSLHDLTWSRDWSDANSLSLATILNSRIADAPANPQAVAVEYRVTSITIVCTVKAIAWSAPSGNTTRLYETRSDLTGPTEWFTDPPGPDRMSITVTGVQDADGSTPATSTAWATGSSFTLTVTDPDEPFYRFIGLSDALLDGGDPGAPATGNGNDADRISTCRMDLAVSFTAEYRYVFDVAPPVRQRQRNDGLTGSSVMRAASAMSTRQGSVRQKAYW